MHPELVGTIAMLMATLPGLTHGLVQKRAPNSGGLRLKMSVAAGCADEHIQSITTMCASRIVRGAPPFSYQPGCLIPSIGFRFILEYASSAIKSTQQYRPGPDFIVGSLCMQIVQHLCVETRVVRHMIKHLSWCVLTRQLSTTT